VAAFAKMYPDVISNGYSDLADEEEVITINFLTTINKKMLDGYFLNGTGTKFK